jgi:hypothetical protein
MEQVLLPVTGAYTILMDPRDVATASATFALYEAVPNARASMTIGGPPVTLATTVPGQNAELAFDGASEQKIHVKVSGISMAPSTCPRFSIAKPDGTFLVSPSFECGSSLIIEVLTLPLAGTYTLMMDPRDVSVGGATFALTPVLQNARATITIGGPPVRLATTTPGQNAELTFSGEGGKKVHLAVSGISTSGSGTCPIFSILLPDGSDLLAPQSVCASSYFAEGVLLPASASYTVLMNPQGDSVASATFALYTETPDATADIAIDGPPVRVTTTVPGQNAALTFTGNPGKKIRLRLSELSPALGCPLVSIVGPTGQTLLAPRKECGPGFVGDTLTLPAAGTYTIVVDPPEERIGSATFALLGSGGASASAPALAASSQAQGKIRLSWSASGSVASAGTVVFRAPLPFDQPDQATRVTSSPVKDKTTLEDLPPADGTYIYRVATIDQAGELGPLSNAVQVIADSVPPKALSVSYVTLGKTNPATGGFGQGQVNVNLSVSEPLQAAPYLAVVPAGGAPVAVSLSPNGELAYTGSFRIDAGMPSGVANVLFSARDVVGNRGTEIVAGATLPIETAGPSMTGIVLQPGSPIRADSGQTVQATFSFSKPPAATPEVKYRLSGPLRTPVAISALSKVDGNTYRGSFSLPADAGRAGPERLSFSFVAVDDLDNVSSSVSATNRFQVYQGALPPPNIPLGVTVRADPGGKVRLAWQAVEDASAYQLYRKGPGQDAFQALARTTSTEYVDKPPQDGVYRYAVAAVRQSNGEEVVSGQSIEVEATASANPPGAPQNLALRLTGQGIYASWQAPLFSTVDSYNLYRASGTSIGSIAGLTPLKRKIKNPLTVDANPTPAEGAYVVTAVDAAGNESAISNSAYLNPSLLPVRQLRVERSGGALPVLSWAAPNGNVSGYLVYIGPETGRIKVTSGVMNATSLTDTGYTSGERRYTVASVDANAVEMPRSILLPNVTARIAAGLPLKRGMMNRLQVQVANTSAEALAEVRALMRLPADRDATAFKDYLSEPFSLGANETRLVSVIVGGQADLPGLAQAEVGLEVVQDEDGLARLTEKQEVEVTDGALVIGIATEEFTRGGTGTVRLTIENTSDVDVELLTASDRGNADSSELRFKLLDGDGNVLATQPYKQVFGPSVVTLPNGLTVARIPAGSKYVSEAFSLNVPASSPDRVVVRLEVDALRFHSGQPDEVRIAGRGSERAVSLLDTAYFGEVTDVSPISSTGDQEILISGRALERASTQPLPNTRLNLALNQEGFERSFIVLTDAAGSFLYRFKPGVTDGGLYKVSAVHPSTTDRPEQKSFMIRRVTVGPSPYKLDAPKNSTATIPFTATAGAGTSATNLRLKLDAASQPTGQIPAGIQVGLPPPVSLAERQTMNLPVTFSASDEAQPQGSLIFDVFSDEGGPQPIGVATVNYTLTEGRPHLVIAPALVETGMAPGGSQIESVTVKNQGLQDAANLRFSLTRPDGSPPPAWASVSSQSDGALAIGQTRTVDLSFMPPGATQLGAQELRLNIVGDNLPAQSVNVFVNLTQSGQGNVLFKASDIYTATMGADGKLIAGLANARITVQNEDDARISRELLTDSLGEAAFQGLPAGSYKFRASATNHQEASGRLQVKPGVAAVQQVFLEYNVITVEWSVREIAFEDRYEVVLKATYETDVPAPVVLLEPSSVNLPKMKAGDVFYGEFSLTNYGLIRADNLKDHVPPDDKYFRYEFLGQVPTSLEAKRRVTLPYRLIAVREFDPAGDGQASGGGCLDGAGADYSVTCSFTCANGITGTCGSAASFFGWASASACLPSGGGGWFGPRAGSGGGGKCVFIPESGRFMCPQ